MFNLSSRQLPKLFAGALWLALLVLLYRYQLAHDMDTSETALMVFDFVTMTTWGPLVYILIYTIRPITFFPASALTILAGVFFGFLYGTLLTIVAATLSAAVAYGIGRFFGMGWKLEYSSLGNWVATLRANTFEAILTMRLIFLPFDAVSYFAGILRVNFIQFLIATFLGILLGVATFVSVGASLDVAEFRMGGFSLAILEWRLILLSTAIFTISIFLSRLLRHWKER